MSLPQLPKPVYFGNEVFAYDTEQMQAYGQTCREQAIEDAEKVCRLLADCEENTTDYRNGAAWCAERIRSLK